MKKNDWYLEIIKNLSLVLEIFYSRGMKTHISVVCSLIPELNSLTSESNLSQNRYTFERLDEDSLKTHLHLKLTSFQNAKNIISDSIIRFSYHMSDHKDYLPLILDNFLAPLL